MGTPQTDQSTTLRTTAGLARPPRLEAHGRLAVVAPSGPVPEWSEAMRGLRALEHLGFELVLGAHVRDEHGYLAGTDEARASDLWWALSEPGIDGVICLRGGYGALRTILALERLVGPHPGPIAPRVVVGYSDITVVHAYIAEVLGWVSFYGPMVISFSHASPYTLDHFELACRSAAAPLQIGPSPDDDFVQSFVPGLAEGRLAGGCLTLLASLVGTPLAQDLSGTILFFEDVNAEPYEVDRLLTQLLAAGRLQHCAGILVGEHVGCRQRDGENSLSLGQVVEDLLVPLGVPMIGNLPVGHGQHLATLPLGARARLDADAGTLTVIEPGVA